MQRWGCSRRSKASTSAQKGSVQRAHEEAWYWFSVEGGGGLYSEDLDYVRRSAGGIAELTGAVTAIGRRLDMEVRTKIGRHPKIYLRAPFESGSATMRLKVEVDTFERAPARPPIRVPHTVASPWFTGSAEVQTFDLAELVATKIRALAEHRSTCATSSSRTASATTCAARRRVARRLRHRHCRCLDPRRSLPAPLIREVESR